MTTEEFVKILSVSPFVPPYHWTLVSTKTGEPIKIYNTIDQTSNSPISKAAYISVPYTMFTYKMAKEILEYLKKYPVASVRPATQEEIDLFSNKGRDIKMGVDYTYPYEHCTIAPCAFNYPPYLVGSDELFEFRLATMEYKRESLHFPKPKEE